MYVIQTPISDDTLFQIVQWIEDSGQNVEIIRVYIDLQNISIGKYYDDNVKKIYLNKSENDVVSLIYYELLNFLSSKINKFKQHGFNNVFFYLYSDEKRNTLNENFIPEWKQNRKKEWLHVKESDPKIYEAKKWLSGLYKGAISSIQELINSSTYCKLLNLEYIDSDFVPSIFIQLDKYYNLSDKTLHIIVSNDHDYVHLVTTNQQANVIRYFFLSYGKQGIIEHKYNIYKRMRSKFQQKSITNEDLKIISEYYPIFHSLIGDSSDGFGSIIFRKGITYWISKFRNILRDKPYDEWRIDILNGDFKYDLLEDDNNYKSFLNRLYIVDFYILTVYILSRIGITLDEYDSQILKNILPRLNFQVRNVLNLNVDKIKNIIFNQNKIDKKEVDEILKHFNVKNKDSILSTLWI